MKPPIRETIRRGLHWRCPNCGRGPLFAGVFRMLPECPYCHLSYYPESGYYVGAMYLNFIVSTIVVTTIYLVSMLSPKIRELSTNTQLVVWIGIGVLLCLALMRHSYSLWLALDFRLNPWPPANSQDDSALSGTAAGKLPSRNKLPGSRL